VQMKEADLTKAVKSGKRRSTVSLPPLRMPINVNYTGTAP
jgi:hypothetical protein